MACDMTFQINLKSKVATKNVHNFEVHKSSLVQYYSLKMKNEIHVCYDLINHVKSFIMVEAWKRYECHCDLYTQVIDVEPRGVRLY